MRKKTGNKARPGISQNSITLAAPRMMLSAKGHLRVSSMCLDAYKADKADNKGVPRPESLSLNLISLENILFSIETSMKLFLLLVFSSTNSIHDLESLFSNIKNKLDNSNELRDSIIENTNNFCRQVPITPVNEIDVKRLLKRHKSSYSYSRYMLLDDLVKPIDGWMTKVKDMQILNCLALGFIATNAQVAEKKNISVNLEVKRIPVSEMTEDEKELVARMRTD